MGNIKVMVISVKAILLLLLAAESIHGRSQPSNQPQHGPIAGCPANYPGSLYVADRFFRCVYYWCVNGEFLEGGRYFSCPTGTAVPSGHYSPFPACTVHEARCQASPGQANSPSLQSLSIPTKHGPVPAPVPSPVPSPTPSPAPTQAPTPVTTLPTTPAPAQGGYYVYQRFHIRGGVQLYGSYNIFDCISSCQGNCKGVDFNLQYNSCWLHMPDTECSPMEEKEECVHIRIDHKC